MLQLVRDVKKSVNSDLSMDWLKPFMTERKCVAGEMLFYKDEKAEDMLYIVSGRFKLVESGIELPVGAIVGELGMLSPSNARTQTLERVEAGGILRDGLANWLERVGGEHWERDGFRRRNCVFAALSVRRFDRRGGRYTAVSPRGTAGRGCA
jgi:hypothetical protein